MHKKSSNIGIWGDTGRYPLLFNALKLAIDYHDRIKIFNDNTLLKKSYLEQKNLNLEWYANVSAIVDKFGSGERKRTSINVNENLNSEFKMLWHNSKTVSEKLAFYNTINLRV